MRCLQLLYTNIFFSKRSLSLSPYKTKGLTKISFTWKTTPPQPPPSPTYKQVFLKQVVKAYLSSAWSSKLQLKETKSWVNIYKSKKGIPRCIMNPNKTATSNPHSNTANSQLYSHVMLAPSHSFHYRIDHFYCCDVYTHAPRNNSLLMMQKTSEPILFCHLKKENYICNV